MSEKEECFCKTGSEPESVDQLAYKWIECGPNSATDYSNWDEIKDENFHLLLNSYLDSLDKLDKLDKYIKLKTNCNCMN